MAINFYPEGANSPTRLRTDAPFDTAQVSGEMAKLSATFIQERDAAVKQLAVTRTAEGEVSYGQAVITGSSKNALNALRDIFSPTRDGQARV